MNTKQLFSALAALVLGTTASAQNGFWFPQLPEASPTWRDAHSLSALDCWIIGGGGLLRHTSDGGLTFTTQELPSTDLRAIRFTSGQRGWVAGGGIFHTSDFGQSWSLQSTQSGLRGLDFANSNRGFACGADGTVLRTTDGGTTWLTSSVGAAVELHAVAALDASTVVAVGAAGRAFRSTDGGVSWTEVGVPTGATLTDVAFFGQEGWIANGGTALYHSTDGGQSFTAVPVPLAVSRVHMLIETHVFAAGSGGVVRTTDGGSQWSSATPASAELRAIHMGDLFSGFAAGDDGEIWRTTNGGAGWTLVDGGVATDVPFVYDMDAVDELRAWAATTSSQILRTVDGGDTWTAVPAGTNTIYRAVDFYDDQFGVACGEKQAFYPTLAYSNDGGASWSWINQLGMWEYYDIAAIAPQVAVAAAETRLYRTTNGGQSWTSFTPMPFGTYRGLDFLDSQRGYAVGTQVVMTDDGGASWTWLYDPPETFNDVGFVDSNTGFMVGLGGAVRRTLDGGVSWTLLATDPVMPDLETIQVFDSQQLLVTGVSGFVARSSDGGLNWTEIPLPNAPNATVYASAFLGPEDGWVSGASPFGQDSVGIWRRLSGETFESFCFGDGGNQTGCTPCPCGNEAPVGTQGGCLNSDLRSGRLVVSGIPSVNADTLRFEVRSAASSTFCVLVSADNRLPNAGIQLCEPGSGILSPAFDGLRCVGGGLQRHGSRPTDGAGDVGLTTNGWGPPSGPPGGILSQSGFTAGQVRHFQVFYRDDDTAICQSGQNTTHAITVAFEP